VITKIVKLLVQKKTLKLLVIQKKFVKLLYKERIVTTNPTRLFSFEQGE